ncbi:MAG: Spy/CpxP family protein refolding chaperone [Rhodomicrobium sp.]
MLKHRIAAVLVMLPLVGISLALAQQSPATGEGGGWHHRWENQGEWHKKMCTERYAHNAARLAYLEAKLAVNDQQRTAWSKWRQTKLDAADQRRSACLQRQPGEGSKLTALEREARREKKLSERLQRLQASRPALQALYDSLSAEQKVIFDEASMQHRWHRHHRRDERGGEGERL